MNDKIIMFDCKKEAISAWIWFSGRYKREILKAVKTNFVIVVPEGKIYFWWHTCKDELPKGDVVKYDDFLLEYNHLRSQKMNKANKNVYFIKNHLLKCGTCNFKKKERCGKLASPLFACVVDDDCECDEYVPATGVEKYL